MENKLITTINLLRQAGFFSSYEGDASKIAEKIIEKSQSSYFGDILNLEDEPLYEQIVLSYDKEICWFIEDSSGFYLSDEVNLQMYIEVFNRLSLISKGLFVPQSIEIKECGYCDGRDKRIVVKYLLNDNETELVFCADGWSLVLNFLEEVNETLEHIAHSFQYIIDPYGPCFIFFVNNQQKNYLEENLEWKFISNHMYWADKAVYYKEKKLPEKVENCFKKALKGNSINTFVEFGIFLKEENRYAEALEMFEKGITVLSEQTPPWDKKEWWLNFITEQIKTQKNLFNDRC